MKKYLFLMPLLLLARLSINAQSIKFADLVYFTSLDNSAVHSNLLQGDSFRQDYSIDINGHPIEYFKNIVGKPGTEKITVGNFTKLYNGTVLRTVTYASANPQHIINMIAQAKHYGLGKTFQGADESNNIYLFDNSFYHVSIYLRRDQTSGLVEIKQKEYLGVE
ncbi:hypothetical protein [Mucilaginibacter sp. L3T2-6]|uniref:hypothetical protein n=1 Tax=Mucilaginibacter sp. L3T2-6 TaxID=3062491 RepID=UPI002676DED7|nr:hypothetical protein [Mucilaginibacter sp. L3T2-6]MDO3640588.1 hypothetical protein [Mucilaginibacter sp. L3T2-6]MDV6213073.1 hypothetical protein [Mucilaginibacter sp. L3T2-6]